MLRKYIIHLVNMVGKGAFCYYFCINYKGIMADFDHTKIEKKWQKKWAQGKIYKAADKSKKPKYYVLDMFPYPSGSAMHVGHCKGYIASDVMARLKMMQGFNVLHPMGWDAFGLPAENFAIKNKIHPAKAVAQNVKTFKKQLELVGFTYDWSREVNTTDPNYYKWTQWLFLKFYENGLGGITRDIKKAKEWYLKAANNGNKESKEILQNEEKHFDYSNKLFDNKLHDDVVKNYFDSYHEKKVTDFKIVSKEYDSKFKETVCYITYINSENVKMYGKITLAKNENNNAWIALNLKSSSVKSDLK